MEKPIIVGESNPYGGDDYYALYPAPDGCSGHRLCCLILGMQRAAYLEAFERVNLVRGKWSIPAARAAANELTARPNRKLILLGAKVSMAFGLKFSPFGTYSERGCAMLILPHPSGLNRMWGEDGVIQRARDAVLAFAPEELSPFVGTGK